MTQGALIACEAFYDTNTRKLTVNIPSEHTIRFESDSEPIKIPKKRGRPTLYSSDEERKAKHREQALQYYYRKKALNSAKNATNNDGSLESLAHHPDEINLTINTHSKTLGDIAEDITFKRVNGRLRKQRTRIAW